MFCPNCWKQVQEGLKFCPFYGQDLRLDFSGSASQKQIQTQPAPKTTTPPRKSSLVAVNIVIAAVVVFAIVVVIIFLTTPGIIPGIGKPGSVVVSGSVTASGTGAIPEKLTFRSTSSGENFVVGCDSGGNPASYLISLPNSDTYTVTMTWKFLGFTAGTANVGTLKLDTFDATMTKDWSG